MGTSAPAVAAPAATSSQGQGGSNQVQPGATGQGQGGAAGTGGQQQGGDNFNWGLFPDVPEAQRELLAPHLRNIQGHVTQMQQRMAPYQGFMDNVSADDVSGVVQFLTNYQNDPVATWLGMAQGLVESGAISAPGFSIDALQALIAGQVPGAPQMGAQATSGEEIPAWAQEMRQQLQTYQQQEQQRQQQAEMQQSEQILNEAHASIREQLTAAGIPEQVLNNLTNEQLTAQIIAHEGDVSKAVQSLIGLRDTFTGAFVQQGGQGSAQPVINGDLSTPKKGGRRGDSFKQASLGAEQMLKQQSAMTG